MREKEVLLLLPIGEVRLKVKFESMLSYEGLCLLLLHWHLRIKQPNGTESSLFFFFISTLFTSAASISIHGLMVTAIMLSTEKISRMDGSMGRPVL